MSKEKMNAIELIKLDDEKLSQLNKVVDATIWDVCVASAHALEKIGELEEKTGNRKYIEKALGTAIQEKFEEVMSTYISRLMCLSAEKDDRFYEENEGETDDT